MAERAGFPAAHGVAAHTGDVKLAKAMVRICGAVIFLFMTALAGCLCPTIAGSMAFNTGCGLMNTQQGKGSLIVIKARRFP